MPGLGGGHDAVTTGEYLEASSCSSTTTMRILVLCTGNSCRSQMAEAWLRHYLPDASIRSAGIEAHGVNPWAAAAMADVGLPLDGHTSDTLGELPDGAWDVVVTVCDHARDVCPVLPGTHRTVHAPFPDPAQATGTEAEIMAQFREVRDRIGRWAEAFASAV